MDLDLKKIASDKPEASGDVLTPGDLSTMHLYRGREYGPGPGNYPATVLLKESYDQKVGEARAEAQAAGEPVPILPSFTDVQAHMARKQAEAAEAERTAREQAAGQTEPAAAQEPPSGPQDGGTGAQPSEGTGSGSGAPTAAEAAASNVQTGTPAPETTPPGVPASGTPQPGTPAPASGAPSVTGNPATGEPETPADPDLIPDGFPHAAKLKAQGVTTFAKLFGVKHEEDLEGIGDKRWGEITAHPEYIARKPKA